MASWVERPTLTLDENVPMRERYAHIGDDVIGTGKMLLTSIMQEIPRSAYFLADAIRLRTAGRFQAEAECLAKKAGVKWREIMLANICYDLMLATMGCSTIAVPTRSGPILARNMDWWPEDLLARASYVLRVSRGPHWRFSSAGWPGSIGVVTALSTRGFAIALNAVLGPERSSLLGYPVLLFLRQVLEDARDFDDALQRLANTQLASPGLFTLVGSENHQRVVVERSPRLHALRWPDGEQVLVATNDYRLLFPPRPHDHAEIYRTTCSRYDALCAHFAGHRGDRAVDDAELLYLLSDPSVKQSITAQHVILRPGHRSINLYVPGDLLGTTRRN